MQEHDRFEGQAPQLLETDELDTAGEGTNQPQPTKLELYRREVREYNRVEKAERAKKRAKRQRAKAGRKHNRKKK